MLVHGKTLNGNMMSCSGENDVEHSSNRIECSFKMLILQYQYDVGEFVWGIYQLIYQNSSDKHNVQFLVHE